MISHCFGRKQTKKRLVEKFKELSLSEKIQVMDALTAAFDMQYTDLSSGLFEDIFIRLLNKIKPRELDYVDSCIQIIHRMTGDFSRPPPSPQTDTSHPLEKSPERKK